MSKQVSPDGKDIWGTSNYKINFTTKSTKFDDKIEGTAVLYEGRWEKQISSIKGINQFVTAMKEMWEESLEREPIQNPRLARWVEEYMIDLGITVSYNLVLKALKGEIIDSEILKIGETRNKFINDLLATGNTINLSDYPLQTEIPENFSETGIQISLPEDVHVESWLSEFLSIMLEKKKSNQETEVHSIVKFIDKDGRRKSFRRVLKLETSLQDGKSIVKSGLLNQYRGIITDVEIEDKVPISLLVSEIDIADKSAIKVSDEIQNAERVIKWAIQKIDTDSNCMLNYNIERKILRSLICYSQNGLNLINTLVSINEVGDKFSAESSFKNTSNLTIDVMKIFDQIPREWKLITTQPELPNKSQKVESERGTDVFWDYEMVAPNSQFTIRCELQPRSYLTRERNEIFNKNGQLVFQVGKLVRQLESQFGYGVILTFKPSELVTKRVILEDHLDSSTKVTIVKSNSGKLTETQNNTGNKIVKWEIEPSDAKDTIHSFLRYKSEKKPRQNSLKVIFGTKEAQGEGKSRISRKEESIVLPNTYHEEVDTAYS